MSEGKLDVWEITLTLKVDPSIGNARPEKWDWDALLDLSSDERVYLESAQFMGEEEIEDGN